MKNDLHSESLLIGLFVGAALGGMAALLLAPASGKKLRRDIAREGRKLAHRVAETVDEVRDKGTEAYERARERVG